MWSPSPLATAKVTWMATQKKRCSHNGGEGGTFQSQRRDTLDESVSFVRSSALGWVLTEAGGPLAVPVPRNSCTVPGTGTNALEL